MARQSIHPTGREVHFGDDEVIVTKTDLRGRITYANDVFLRVSGYHEREMLGQPHNVVRHPSMPRCIFRVLWETIRSGKEVFAYVVNLAKCGDHYWVFAHVTPSYDSSGAHVGYHSNRRVPHADAKRKVTALYDQLLAVEKKHTNAETGIRASTAYLAELLRRERKTYEEFVFSLSEHTRFLEVAR